MAEPGSPALEWTRKAPGAPSHARVAHGLWQVSEQRTGGAAELAYVAADADGRLPAIPALLGQFSSGAEAMLAAEVLEAWAALGAAPAAPRVAGRRGEAGAVAQVESTDAGNLLSVAGSPAGFLMRPRADGGHMVHGRPRGIPTTDAADTSALLAIADARMSRPDGHATRPLDDAEFHAWRQLPR